jgi:hypothetical protein
MRKLTPVFSYRCLLLLCVILSARLKSFKCFSIGLDPQRKAFQLFAPGGTILFNRRKDAGSNSASKRLVVKSSNQAHKESAKKTNVRREQSAQEINFERFHTALQVFKDIDSSDGSKKMKIPREFEVPIGDPLWPTECWGLKLGSKAAMVRLGRSKVTGEQRTRLDSLGFDWDSPLAAKRQESVHLVDCFAIFKDKYDSNSPLNY